MSLNLFLMFCHERNTPFNYGLPRLFKIFDHQSIKLNDDEHIQHAKMPLKIKWIPALPQTKNLHQINDNFTSLAGLPIIPTTKSNYKQFCLEAGDKQILTQQIPDGYQGVPIYIIINYPLTRSAIFKISFNKSIPYTYGMLLYAHATVYNITYQIDNMYTDMTKCEGPFGIWGHQIEDIVYNGIGHIRGVPHEFIICEFDCDS